MLPILHLVTDQTQHATPRSGAPWSDSEHELLVDGLRNGLVLEDIAAQLGRSLKAVHGRLLYLVPAQAQVAAREREQWLREQLALTGVDWQAVIREHYRSRGWTYWTQHDEQALLDAWQRHTPLAEVAAQFATSELATAKALIQQNLATDLAAVAARLGTSSGSTLDLRLRLAADRAAAAVWVLVIDGATDADPAQPLPHRRHLSVHASHDDALATLGRILSAAEATAEVSWSIAERTPGEETVGATHHDLLPTTGDSPSDTTSPEFAVSSVPTSPATPHDLDQRPGISDE